MKLKKEYNILTFEQSEANMIQAAKLIAEVVATANIFCGKQDEDEGETVDFSTYGTSPEIAEMYMDNLPNMVSEYLRIIQPILVNDT